MEIVFMWIGILVVVTILLVISGFSVNWIIERLHDRKYNALESNWKISMADIERYCDYEFPQIGFMAHEIIDALSRGCNLSGDNFREKLRAKFRPKP